MWIAGCASEPATPAGQPLTIKLQREPWSGPHLAGQILTTDHYRIYATTNNSTLVNTLPGFLEAARRNYLQMIHLPERPAGKKLPIYMMANRQEWALLTENVISGGRDAVLSIEAGGYCHQGVCVFWDLGGRGTYSIAAHEGFHQLLYHRLKDRLPMWAEEGLCASAEGYHMEGWTVRFTPDTNPMRVGNLRDGILRQQWLSMVELLPRDGLDAAGGTTERAVSYYGQLWAMSVFLRTNPAYRQRFRRMLADAEAGRFVKALGLPARTVAELRRQPRLYNRTVSEPLFRYYISDDLEAFEREYRAFAETLVDLGS